MRENGTSTTATTAAIGIEAVPPSLLLRSATLTSGERVDVRCEDGVITHVAASLQHLGADEVVDLDGHILTTSFVEPHAHLDKAFLADRITNSTGDLVGAIHGLHAVRHILTRTDTTQRAIRAAELMSRNGVTSIRTHADTVLDSGTQNIEALNDAKQACAGFMEIQVAMLLEWPLSGVGSRERHALANDAIAVGIDVVGGCPHLDDDPKAAIDYLLELAVNNDLPLDLHADENLRPDSCDLEYVADLMISNNVRHRVNASHCVSLSARSEHDMRRIAEKVAEAGISVTALPQTNLFLQARGQFTLPPRAITPLSILRQAGVTVAGGADNLQDPFNSMGRGDPLEIASLLVTASHVSPTEALSMVSTDAERVVHGTSSSVEVGAKANLVALRAATVRESIAMGPPDRVVVYGGVVINEHIRNRK